MLYRIGDIVKLRDYSGYGDYMQHDGEAGAICEPPANLEGSGFDCSIEWSDGEVSNAVFNNIYYVDREWDDEVNR